MLSVCQRQLIGCAQGKARAANAPALLEAQNRLG